MVQQSAFVNHFIYPGANDLHFLTKGQCPSQMATRTATEVSRLLTPQFLLLIFLGRLTVQPHPHKQHKAPNDGPQSCNPRPRRTNPPASWPLIVREVPYRNLSSFLEVREEGTLVVDFEGEDAMLIRSFEGCGEDCRVLGCRGRLQGEPLERTEHRELELESIGRGWGVRGVVGA